MSLKRIFFLSIAILILASPMHAGSLFGDKGTIHITCTTTHIAAILEAVGGDKVEITTVIPSGMCPGHFDISPGELINIRNSELVIYHGYERFMKDLIKENQEKNAFVKVDVNDNWMIPNVHVMAVREIETILSSEFPDLSGYFSNNAEMYIQRIMEAKTRLLVSLEDVRGRKVVASSMNADFIKWTGLEIICTFGRDEDISLKEYSQVAATGARENAELVIDNLQSSGKTGQTLAAELEIPFQILSNFPEQSDKGYTYLNTLYENCARLLKGLERKEL